MSKIRAKVYVSLKSLNFHRKAFSFEIKKQLIQTLVIPQFDYASVVYSHLDKTRGKSLQVAHNACVRFVTSYAPFIPSLDVKSHITHCRLKLGWFSLASCRYLQLLVWFYRIVSAFSPNDLYRMISPPPSPNYEPAYLTRGPPALFNVKRARTEAWNVSFIISGQRLANRLRIFNFKPKRVAELKTLVFNIIWRAEINASRRLAVKSYEGRTSPST